MLQWFRVLNTVLKVRYGDQGSAMCLAGREHSATVKQKGEKQQQKQPLRMARATERWRLPFPLCGLAAHGSSTTTGGRERCPAREDNGGRDL